MGNVAVPAKQILKAVFKGSLAEDCTDHKLSHNWSVILNLPQEAWPGQNDVRKLKRELGIHSLQHAAKIIDASKRYARLWLLSHLVRSN